LGEKDERYSHELEVLENFQEKLNSVEQENKELLRALGEKDERHLHELEVLENVQDKLNSAELENKKGLEVLEKVQDKLDSVEQANKELLRVLGEKDERHSQGLDVLKNVQDNLVSVQQENKKGLEVLEDVQNKLDSVEQEKKELLLALERHDERQPRILESLEPQLTRHYEAISQPPTIGAMSDEAYIDPSLSCGHLQLGTMSFTGCQVLLCEYCDNGMKLGMIAGSSVIDCPWCHELCSVTPLPEVLTLPWMSEWNEVADQWNGVLCGSTD